MCQESKEKTLATDILDRLQENRLRGLEELIASGQLEELIQSWQGADNSGGPDDQAGAIADFFVDEGIGLRLSSLHLWDYNWTTALAGQFSDRQERGKKLRSLLERGGRILARYAAAARAYADRSGHEVARLAAFEEQARAFPHWVAECMTRWELLDRPRKPLNRERVARSQAAFERGECEGVADILSRIEQGDPLAKE